MLGAMIVVLAVLMWSTSDPLAMAAGLHRQQLLVKDSVEPIDFLFVKHRQESKVLPNTTVQELLNRENDTAAERNHSPRTVDGADVQLHSTNEDDENNSYNWLTSEEEQPNVELLDDELIVHTNGGPIALSSDAHYNFAMYSLNVPDNSIERQQQSQQILRQLVNLNELFAPIQRPPMMMMMMSDNGPSINNVMQNGNNLASTPVNKPGSTTMMPPSVVPDPASGGQGGAIFSGTSQQPTHTDSSFNFHPPLVDGAMPADGVAFANTTLPGTVTLGEQSTTAPTNSISTNVTLSAASSLSSLSAAGGTTLFSNSGSRSVFLLLCFLAIPLIIGIIVSLGANEILLVVAVSIVFPLFLFVAFALSGVSNSNQGRQLLSLSINDYQRKQQRIDDQLRDNVAYLIHRYPYQYHTPTEN